MKKIVALVLALMMMLATVAFAEGEIKIGQVQFAAHGNKCFAVITAVVQDGVIVAAHIDEYQYMATGTVEAVPNSDTGLASYVTEGYVLASKRLNNETYSNNMATKAGATQQLVSGYTAIESFAVGKTVAELEAAIEGKTSADMLAEVDAVSTCTLVDTLGYLQGIVAAAKAAE